MRYQQTLETSSFLSGIGLHSGNPASIAIHPAPVNTGVVFVVKHEADQIQSCPAGISFLGQTDHCTTLQAGDFGIQTVEHVLSALAGLEIDNAYVELLGSEIPAADGSATPFVDMVYQSGILTQDGPRKYLKIVQPITVEDAHRSISVLPSALPQITYNIDFPHPLIKQQEYHHFCTPHEYGKNIAGARTFAFQKEVEFLWSRGLGLGGSLQNTVVFSDTGLVNDEDLRFSDECVRHKILDLIGDLSLLGIPVIGHFIAKYAGHALHTQLVQAIMHNPDKWIMLNAGETGKDGILNGKNSSNSTIHPSELQPAFHAF
ncbi:MAG: UDP-3-O-acyl-N-acetylglucosamine deacetylase [Nitrospirales bacterium]|nr:MAG: UDP-3-O-acyl-N-acetylglucosamine deacetylase [Nitrospirales bacterium]